jgi:hypothetical protein
VALFALAAVGLASAAHLAGGENLSLPAAVLAVPAVMLAVYLLAGRRRGPSGLLIAMGLTQVALHLAFMATSAAQACRLDGVPAMAGMPMQAAHSAHSAHAALHCGPAMTHGAAAHAWLWPSTPMLLAHALATVLLVLILAHGEAAVWALAASLGFRVLRPGAVLLVLVLRRGPVPVQTAFRPRSSVPRRSVRRRGPPRSTVAVL